MAQVHEEESTSSDSSLEFEESSHRMNTHVPPEALAANWAPEIIEAYMAQVQKERELGREEEEAMSSDSEAEFDVSMSSTSSDTMSDIVAQRAIGIESDDSAFSSEDEFAPEKVLEIQKTRRELVLGRIPPEILQLHQKDLKDVHEAYMKQLDDADVEIEELTGVPRQVIIRRKAVCGLEEKMGDVEDGDVEGLVVELRKRSGKGIAEKDKRTLLEQLVVLAQALFRKEREIKHLLGRN